MYIRGLMNGSVKTRADSSPGHGRHSTKHELGTAAPKALTYRAVSSADTKE